jgi:hypothetical protein
MPFRKGQSGNLNGAPVKEHRLSYAIQKELSGSRMGDYNKKIAVVQLLAKKLVDGAFSDDPKLALEYIREIMNRTEGRPRQSADLTTNGDSIASPIFGGLSITKAPDAVLVEFIEGVKQDHSEGDRDA